MVLDSSSSIDPIGAPTSALELAEVGDPDIQRLANCHLGFQVGAVDVLLVLLISLQETKSR